MINIVLFGPPGAGKGTQSKLIEQKYDLAHISTGDLLFEEVSQNTLLGQKAKEFMLSGKLVPDELVISMLENKMRNNRDSRGFVFDGFPRNQKQATTLDQLLDQLKISINLVIALDVPEEDLVRRVLNRGKEKGRFDDQNEGIVRNRLKTYALETAPLAEYYRKQRKFVSINGLGNIEDVSETIFNHINTRVKV